MQISQWIKQASGELAAFDTPRLDADLLMCHVLICDRTKLYAWPEKLLTSEQEYALQCLLQRRLQGEPIAYLTGEREFWSLRFKVDKNVLVPRPDTELIVELALQALAEQTNCNEPVLDAGTGSGVIAIALYTQWKMDRQESLSVIASDYSDAALALAKYNAEQLDAVQINFVRSNWLSAFANNSIGMIISNPPYLAVDDPHMKNDTLDFEPEAALVSGDNGLDAISIIVSDACRVGKSGCHVLIEHGYQQAFDVQNLMLAAHYTKIQTHKDINDLDRVTSGFCPKY